MRRCYGLGDDRATDTIPALYPFRMENGRGSRLSWARIGLAIGVGAVVLAACIKPAPPPPPPPNPTPTEHYMVSPNPVAFGDISSVMFPVTPPELLVTVRNDGTGIGTPTISIVGDAHLVFDFASPQFTCGQSGGNVITWNHLQPGQSCTVPVKVDPTSGLTQGPMSAEVRVFGWPSGGGLLGPFTTEVTANITP
jgi:hypothetical protein